jgi:hypothetical protein
VEARGRQHHSLRQPSTVAWFPFKGAVLVPSAEVAVMLCKVAVFRDESAWGALCLGPDPDEAKCIGRDVGIHPRGWWVRRSKWHGSLCPAAGEPKSRACFSSAGGAAPSWSVDFALSTTTTSAPPGRAPSARASSRPIRGGPCCHSALAGSVVLATNAKDKVWGVGMARGSSRIPFVTTEAAAFGITCFRSATCRACGL